jgi:hypothetical protein
VFHFGQPNFLSPPSCGFLVNWVEGSCGLVHLVTFFCNGVRQMLDHRQQIAWLLVCDLETASVD